MKIKQNSLNYRLYEKFYSYDRPRNICEYFWKNVFMYAVSLVALLASLFIISLLIIDVNTIYNILTFRECSVEDLKVFVVIQTLIFAFYYLISLTLLFSKDLLNYSFRHNNKMYMKYKYDSKIKQQKCLFIEYLKALKRKVCPLIELVD